MLWCRGASFALETFFTHHCFSYEWPEVWCNLHMPLSQCVSSQQRLAAYLHFWVIVLAPKVFSLLTPKIYRHLLRFFIFWIPNILPYSFIRLIFDVIFGYNPGKKYMRQSLVFVWNSVLENFNFYFSTVVAGIDKFFILGQNWALGYNSVKFEIFLILFHKVLSFKLFINFLGSSYIPRLLLIIMIFFICAKIKVQ